MITPVEKLVEEANKEIETISVADAITLHADAHHVFIDIRDVRELWREGAVPDAVHAPRGMLEFWIDPASPYHREVFAQSDKKYVLFCAAGWRSALAARTLQDMGFGPVAHIDGGFSGWKEAGGPTKSVEPPSQKD